MRKTYQMEDLDCAVCAAKMEDAIRKIDGVESVSINYIMQQMTIEADESRLAGIMKQASKACRKIERNCRIIM
ncbi:MAG: heavy-metal-associated domain-containing protein [Clostridia bacterium]|nr:heavy-metal-associated domain-containing protein [Clostridia bacterium]